MYKDGVVVAGSLDGLISLLLPSQTHQIEVGGAMGVVFSNELSYYLTSTAVICVCICSVFAALHSASSAAGESDKG